jgi:hypothetical protein
MGVTLQSMPGNAFFILWSLIFVPTLTTGNLTEHETPFLPTRLVTIGAPAQAFVALSSVGVRDAVLELLFIRVAIAGSFKGGIWGAGIIAGIRIQGSGPESSELELEREREREGRRAVLSSPW